MIPVERSMTVPGIGKQLSRSDEISAVQAAPGSMSFTLAFIALLIEAWWLPGVACAIIGHPVTWMGRLIGFPTTP